MGSGLDRSIPFHRVIMRISPERVRSLPFPELPDGYSFRTYRPGDLAVWSTLETSVDEFQAVPDAEKYFAKDFLPEESRLSDRMFFVCDRDGKAVGTGTAWQITSNGTTKPLVHWISVSPEHQGKKLGKSIVLRVLKCFESMDPGEEIYLETQTWSHPAIGLYLKLGFQVMSGSHRFLQDKNECEAAEKTLESVMDRETLRLFRASVTD